MADAERNFAYLLRCFPISDILRLSLVAAFAVSWLSEWLNEREESTQKLLFKCARALDFGL